nr:MAG TPA: hypothetical protein [Caudoviricetes sp.]
MELTPTSLLPGGRSATYNKVTCPARCRRARTHSGRRHPKRCRSEHPTPRLLSPPVFRVWGEGSRCQGAASFFFGAVFFSSKFRVVSFRCDFRFCLFLLLFCFVFLFCLFVLCVRLGVAAVRVWLWRVCVPWLRCSRVWSWPCGRRATGLGDYLVRGCRRR